MLLHAAFSQGGGDAIGHLVHLFIGVFGINSHQCLMVGLCLCKVSDTLVEEGEGDIGGNIACVHLAQMAQFLLLALAHDRQLAQAGLRCFHHPHSNSHNALGYATPYPLAVNRIVILYNDSTRFNLNVNLELGHIEFQQFLSHRLTVYSVLRQHAHLIGIGDGGTETVVGSNARERIILMAKRLVKCVARIFQELFNRHIINVHAQGERIDKHTHRVGNLEVAAAAADGTQINVTVIGIARDDISRSTQEQVGWCNLLTTAEGCGTFQIYRTYSLANETLLIGFGQVGRNLAGTLTGLQFLGKELLGCLEGLAFLGSLLIGNKVQVVIGLFLNRIALKESIDLTNEQVGRASVKYQVMDIQQQVDTSRGLDHLGAVQGRFLQVERTNKLILVFRQFFFSHFGDIHLNGNAILGRLDNAVALGSKVDIQLGMRLNDKLHSISKTISVNTFGIGKQIRNVIDGRSRILQAVKINTRLCIGQRSTVSRLLSGRRKILRLYRTFKQCFKDFVLDRLDGTGLDKAAGVESHTIALVDLHCQLNGRNRCQASIAQHRRHTEVGVIDNVGDYLVDFLFQHIHWHIDIFGGSRLLFRLGQCTLVHLLVLVQWDGINLHGHSRYHIGRLLVQNEVVERFNIHLVIADDIGRNELAATFLVKGLNRCILNARELADDTLDLLQLDAETTNFHLTVAATHKLDIARGQIANDIARAIYVLILFVVSKRIGDIDLGGLLRTVQVTAAHLGTSNQQFTSCSHRQTMTLWVNNI